MKSTTKKYGLMALVFSLALSVAACSKSEDAAPNSAVAEEGAELPGLVESDAAAMAANPRLVVVYKNESCGCCHQWVEHLRKSGFQVTVRDVSNLGPTKERVGIPYGMGSCHTAQVGGYFVEGHVQAADILRLLEERPAGKGLTVPGMPIGSPGMEIEGEPAQPYDVHLVALDGTTSVYTHYNGQASANEGASANAADVAATP